MKVDIPNYDERDTIGTEIVIHSWDTWSMDHTLALIILPMLKQLKATKHGYPSDLNEEEWDSILDEMIYAFDCKANQDEPYIRIDDIEECKKEQSRISNGFRLFGKYYENLWD